MACWAAWRHVLRVVLSTGVYHFRWFSTGSAVSFGLTRDYREYEAGDVTQRKGGPFEACGNGVSRPVKRLDILTLPIFVRFC